MQLYTYKTLDGDVTIEVDDVWYEWLDAKDKEELDQERSHVRPDHKYAPGTPISFDAHDSLDDWLVFSTMTCYRAVELKIDLEMALERLTPLQRRYFIMNRLQGRTLSEIAETFGKQASTIMRLVEVAERKIKNFMK